MQSVNPYTLEKRPFTIKVDEDPTGTVPAFAVIVTSDGDPTGDWVNGEWNGSWDSTTEKVSGYTPTLGKAGAGFELAAGSEYNVWIKLSGLSGSQEIVEVVEQIRCEVT